MEDMEDRSINLMRDLIKDQLSGYNARHESGLDLINFKLDTIKLDLMDNKNKMEDVLNRVDLLEKNYLKSTNKKCYHEDKLNEFEKFIDKNKNIRKFLVGSLGIIAMLLTIITSLYLFL